MGYSMLSETPDGELLFSPEGFGTLDVKKAETIKKIIIAVLKNLKISGTGNRTTGYTESSVQGQLPTPSSNRDTFTVVCEADKSPVISGDFHDKREVENVQKIAKHIADAINTAKITIDISSVLVNAQGSSGSGITMDALSAYLQTADLERSIDALEKYAVDDDIRSFIDQIKDDIESQITELSNKETQDVKAINKTLENVVGKQAEINNAINNIPTIESELTEVHSIVNQNTQDISKLDVSSLTARVRQNETDIETLFQYASDGKTLIATAITGKGVSASNSDTFGVLANKISQIQTGGSSGGGSGKLKAKFYTQADSLYTIRGASGSGEFETIHKFNGKGIVVFTETGSMGQNCCEPDFFSGTEFRVIVDGTEEHECIEEGDSIAFNTSLDIQCCTYSATHDCWAMSGDPIIAYWMGVITFLE